jgi:hypothetical protein
MEPIRFQVSYRFSEYRSFVLDHVRQQGYSPSYPSRLALAAFATVVFAVKRRVVGPCTFTIDEAGVRRLSKQGDFGISWTEVERVRRYSQCYLVEFKSGAIPIPYRCLDSVQRSDLERLLLRQLHA